MMKTSQITDKIQDSVVIHADIMTAAGLNPISYTQQCNQMFSFLQIYIDSLGKCFYLEPRTIQLTRRVI